MTTAIEPSADEIERVKTAARDAWLRGRSWYGIAAAAALAMDRRAEVVGEPVAVQALKAAREFIRNGVEFGYIHMPDRGDPAHKTLPLIEAALASPPAPAVAVPENWKLVPVDDPSRSFAPSGFQALLRRGSQPAHVGYGPMRSQARVRPQRSLLPAA